MATLRVTAVFVASLLFEVGLSLAVAVALLAVWLHPAAQEWSRDLEFGALRVPLSVPKLIRLGAQPVSAAALDGRVIRIKGTSWLLGLNPQGLLRAECAPCSIRHRALGTPGLHLDRVGIELLSVDGRRFGGRLKLQQDSAVVGLSWNTMLEDGGLVLDLQMRPQPIAGLVELLADAIPEARRARIDGTLALDLHVDWPQGVVRLRPQFDGFQVAGLGTQRLRSLRLPADCGDRGTVKAIAGWMPRAIIAAEDQRFAEHPGYDLSEIENALESNRRGAGPLRGASTLTQQLAKRLYTGDDRNVLRKLREVLYAVEMERTLGKARILQLYMAVAPFAGGVCGVEQAARIYLHKPVQSLTPVEAAWLASLLTNPALQLRQQLAQGQVDRTRLVRIVEALRPTGPQRQARRVAQALQFVPYLIQTAAHNGDDAARLQIAAVP